MKLTFVPDSPETFDGLMSASPVDRRRLAALIPYWEKSGISPSRYTKSSDEDIIYSVNVANSLSVLTDLFKSQVPSPAIVIGVTEDILTAHWAGSEAPLTTIEQIASTHFRGPLTPLNVLKTVATRLGLRQNRTGNLLAAVRRADVVICASEAQAASLRHINPFTFAIAEAIPDSDFGEDYPQQLRDLQKLKEDQGAIFILWEGTAWGLMLLDTIRPQLEKLSRTAPNPVRLVVSMPETRPTPFYGLTNNKEILERNFNMPTSFVQWSKMTIGRIIRMCDIGIAPMPELNPFYAAKAHNKPAVYMKFGLPVVAANILAYQNLITDGRDGFIAKTPEDWFTHLSNLVANQDLRLKTGRAAEDKFKSRCAISETARQFEERFRLAIDVHRCRNRLRGR